MSGIDPLAWVQAGGTVMAAGFGSFFAVRKVFSDQITALDQRLTEFRQACREDSEKVQAVAARAHTRIDGHLANHAEGK